MKDLDVVDGIQSAGGWIVRNQDLLLGYAVNLVAAVVILIVGSLIARGISATLIRLLKARGLDVTVVHFLAAMVRYGILAFTIIAALGRLGVQTTSVIAVLGAAGLAVGLALQGSLSNFAAGVLLVLFRPFRAGEVVDLGGVTGTVREVQIFSTTLATADNKVIVVPNGKIIAGNIINSLASRSAVSILSWAWPTTPISTWSSGCWAMWWRPIRAFCTMTALLSA